jgi:DNA-binding PucR family transcriptional regulator
VTTLRAFLASGGRWRRTADGLHVHPNTLRHRLERVEALTGRALDRTADRVDFHLALALPAPD